MGIKRNYYGSLCTEMYEILHREAPQDELAFYLSYAKKGMKILDKTTPRLIQFHTFKNAANPPFLGGFSIFSIVAA